MRDEEKTREVKAEEHDEFKELEKKYMEFFRPFLSEDEDSLYIFMGGIYTYITAKTKRKNFSGTADALDELIALQQSDEWEELKGKYPDLEAELKQIGKSKTFDPVEVLEALKSGKQLKKNNLLALDSVLPAYHTSPNTLLSNSLSLDDFFEKWQSLPVGKGMRTSVYVTQENEAGITFSRPFTAFDRSVYDAVCSLYLYGNQSHVFTASVVMRAMNGKTESEKVHKKQIDAINQSVEKMSLTRIAIDASEEFAKRGITDKEGNAVKYQRRPYLLAVEPQEVTAGGKTVTGYVLLQKPILLEYAEYTKELCTVKAEWLDIKETSRGKRTVVSIPMNEDRTIIRDYLIRRIKSMQSKKDRRKKYVTSIKFETIFEQMQNPPKDRTEKKRVRDYVCEVLDFFKTKDEDGDAMIKGYEVCKDGQRIKGVKIIL